jgi:hypothetical protein
MLLRIGHIHVALTQHSRLLTRTSDFYSMTGQLNFDYRVENEH